MGALTLTRFRAGTLRVALLLPLAALALSPPATSGAATATGPALADIRTLPSPAAPASAEPHLAVSPDGRVWLSWLEKRTRGGHALRVARLDGERWATPSTVAEGDSFFANWADFPTVLPLGGDRLAAHYLWKTGAATYAYEVRTTRSDDGGHSWNRAVSPHRDGTPTEHGFVSLLPAGPGVRAVWLDGRNGMGTDSAGRHVHREEGEADMTLRTAVVGADGALTGEALLDPRACDCCQTAAVATARGVLVAYRDRSPQEIRDISVVRFEDGAWSQPEPLHADGWTIEGCPVNGPSLAAAGDRIAVAWYTAAQDSPRVLVAFSDDGGHRFDTPVRVDGGAPLGRVSVLLEEGGGALVAWLEAGGKQALFQVRSVSRVGAPGPVTTVARTAAARGSGFPRMARHGDRVVLAWTEAGTPSQVRTATARVGAGAASLTGKVRAWRVAHEASILREFAELLRIPNVASDSVNIRRNADQLVALLERRGVTARRLESPGSPPAVYGELKVPGARRTLVLYAHYDGQPVVPKDWAGDPWVPMLRDRALEEDGREVPFPAEGTRAGPEWRLYARAAGDDKGPIIAMLAALDALQATRTRPSVNLKIFLEGEEEAGSPHLRDMLERHRALLTADGWIFCDGPMHQSRRHQVVFGVRGSMGLELTVYGPARAPHSGHYGNWAPNPISLMTTLLASLRDADGRILVPGLTDAVRPVSAAERAAMSLVPDPDSTLRDELQLGATEAGNARLIERLMLPAINFRGVRAGGVGETATNSIPTEARASIDFRLVPDQTPGAVRRSVEDHLRAQGWTIAATAPDGATRRAHARIVRLEWGRGYPAYRTALDAPFPRAVLQSMEETLGQPILMAPTLGGSLPLYLFKEVLGAPVIVLPIANHDDNQHAANENIRLQNLWDGIEIFAGLLARFGESWR